MKEFEITITETLENTITIIAETEKRRLIKP